MRCLILWMKLHDYLMNKNKTYIFTGRYFGSVLFLYQSTRRDIMGWLIFAGGLIFGSVIGLIVACAVMINNTRVANRDTKKR